MNSLEKKKLFLEVAKKFSLLSKDPSTKVGSIIVDNSGKILSVGYNGFPSKYPDKYDISREKKLGITIHSEVNAILNAAKNGTSLEGSTIYVSEPPCSNCAAALINAGIKVVVHPHNYTLSDNWESSLNLARELFSKCKVKIEAI